MSALTKGDRVTASQKRVVMERMRELFRGGSKIWEVCDIVSTEFPAEGIDRPDKDETLLVWAKSAQSSVREPTTIHEKLDRVSRQINRIVLLNQRAMGLAESDLEKLNGEQEELHRQLATPKRISAKELLNNISASVSGPTETQSIN